VNEQDQGNPSAAATSAAEPPAPPAIDETLVQLFLKRERARREAVRRLESEERPPVVPPPLLTLRDRLLQLQPPTRWRIAGWQPIGARVMLTAQYKTGKTTLVMNHVQSLVTGDRLFGVAEVTLLDGPVLVIDAEMSPTQLDQWYRECGIEHDDRVLIWPLRGTLSAFNILDVTVRAQWAARFRALGVRYVVLDCLRPFFDAFGLDENRDAGKFLVAFDALLAEADIPEALVVHHMGHGAERARGDSRLRDWPDVEWRLVREREDDSTSRRYNSAYGRDVDIEESALAYDDAFRRLILSGDGSRRDAAVRRALAAVLELLGAAPEPLSGRAVEDALEQSEHSQKAIRAALKLGIKTKAILCTPGPRGAGLHRLPPTDPTDPRAHSSSASARRSAS
jgi:hypothetical protein